MLIDTTLREGAQMYGVDFPEQTKQRIVRELIRVGVEEIELGWCGQSGLPALYDWSESLGAPTRFTVWSPLREKDLRTLAQCGVKRVHLGMPVSDAHMVQRLGLDRHGMEVRLIRTLESAMDMGFAFLSLGLEDVSRADPGFALRMAETAQAHGADRIRLSDTVGLLSPLGTAKLIRRFRQRLDVPVAFHGHNDFGMAAANALTALEAGAACVDVSVLGLGERAGIAALEEVCAFLCLAKGEKRYDPSALKGLSELVAAAADVPVARNKAITGKDVFACETGLHLHGLDRDPGLFEPFAPEQVNATRKLGFGTKIGRAAVQCIARRATTSLTDLELKGMMGRIKSLARQRKRPLNETEALGLLDITSLGESAM